MTDPDHRFAAARTRFWALHATDPAGGDPTPAQRYHQTLVRFLDELAPKAPEPVRLAALCQHVQRWEIPRADYPAGGGGYKRWRADLARFHGDQAANVLGEVGYDDAVIARVRDLLLKKRLRTDPDVALLEDAICLTFLALDFGAFADKHPDDKVVEILRKTWAKMTPRGQARARSLTASLDERHRALLERALRGAE